MANIPPWQLVLQLRFNLLNHLCVFRITEFRLAKVHGEHNAPLETIPILQHEMDIQVAASVPLHAVALRSGAACSAALCVISYNHTMK